LFVLLVISTWIFSKLKCICFLYFILLQDFFFFVLAIVIFVMFFVLVYFYNVDKVLK
jgi:hypothetical protein